MKYRKDIDGLRAVAVMPVILYHAGIPWFSGGYVGVDVFFVISGFLITTIILEELQSDKFSILSFYERRIRRILPPLFFMLLVCVPFAKFYMSPGSFQEFSESLAAVSVFSSNFYFWLQSGYFDTASEIKPLLHTWSLAVEEQFYVLFPALLLILVGFRQRAYWLVFGIGFVASLMLVTQDWGFDESAQFYLLPFRAWELLLGSLCSLFLLGKAPISKFSNLISSVGLLLIVGSVFLYDRFTPFPSLYTLAPTVGTALIILSSDHGTITGRILKHPVSVFIGLTSYSAFLWHQPVFVFARLANADEPSAAEFAVLIMIVFLLAYVSLRFVEAPFRNKKYFSRAQIMGAFAACSLIVAATGAYGTMTASSDIFSEKTSKLYGVMRPAKFSGIVDDEGRNCSNREIQDLCIIKGRSSSNWVVIGDSHARVLTQALLEELRGIGADLSEMSTTGCPFVPGHKVTIFGVPNKKCTIEFNNERMKYLLDLPPSNIVIQSRLSFYLGLGPLKNGQGFVGKDYQYLLDIGAGLSDSQRVEEVGDAIIDGYGKLQKAGHTLILVMPVPSHGWHVPNRVDKQVRSGYSTKEIMVINALDFDVVLTRSSAARGMLSEVKNVVSDGVILVDPAELFCNSFLKNKCVSSTTTDVLYADGDHLSEFGNKLLASKIISAVVPQ